MHEDLRSAAVSWSPKARTILADLVRIPSVSAPGYPASEVERSARHVAGLMEEAGFGDVRLLELDGAHPAVYGHLPAPEGAPTVLLYAHHDVQPPGPADDWLTGPFEPFEQEGRLFGRGASDNKAGIVMHLGAIAAHGGRPPVGVKMFVEGEEETGSGHLVEFLDTYAKLLNADVIVIGDSGNWAVGAPALTTSLRGIVSCLIEVRTLEAPVHSGLFGGVFPDALTVLARCLATLHDEQGNVAVPGLVSEDGTGLDLSDDLARSMAGAVAGLETMGEGSITARLWTKPAVSVLAIDAPPVAEAINQLVPVARAKVSMRIAPGQDTGAALDALRLHLESEVPWGAQVTVSPLESGDAFRLSTENAASRAWKEALSLAFGTDAVEMGVGGSIPFVAAFSDLYPDAPLLLTGAGDPTSSVHAPNESQDLADLEKSILAEAIALRLLAQG